MDGCHLGRSVQLYDRSFLWPKDHRLGQGEGHDARAHQKSEDFLDKWGHLAIFLGRFFPFIRTFVPFIAGMGGMHWRNFVIFNVLGGITWSTVFTLLGYFFGGIPFVQEHFELLIIGIVAVSIIPTVVGLVKAKLGKKNA